MSGRKQTKRKRRALEALRSRWSPPSPPPSPGRKDFACQVNLFAEQKNSSSVTVATQTGEREVEEVELLSTVDDIGVADFIDPKQLYDFCNFQGPISTDKEQHKSQCDKLEEDEEDVEEKETICKVQSFFSEKNHNIQELTKNTLRVKKSPFVIATSEKLRQVFENKCGKCGQTGTLKFEKETEPQTGVVKLEYVCTVCAGVYTVSSSDETIPTRTKPKT